jgi:hypothetical protein
VPDAVQKTFETSAGLFAASKNMAAAQAMLDFFAAPAHQALFSSKGLEQVAKS